MTDKRPLVAAHWGTYRAEMKDGHAVTLEPFEDDPAPSPIGGAMLETLNDPCRIGQPMVRQGFLDGGNRDRRGYDSFVAVSWDKALDLVARELDRVRNDHGNEAIFAGSYGWASAGRFHHAQSQLRRFMNMFGGATTSKDTYSFAAGQVILPHVVGDMQKLLMEHSSWQGIAERRSLVVAFGGIALRNAQVNSGGVAMHTHKRDMHRAVDAGAEIVNVNPSAQDLAGEVASEWLPIRPNTDLALMLALAHTLVTEKHHNHTFIDRYCTGFERFLPYLTGEIDGQPKDAAWAGEITGIPPKDITALARKMAARPTTISASWSLTRQQNGEQIYWMTVVLAAMLGGIGRKGEGFALGIATTNSVGSQRSPMPLASLPTGRNPVRSFIPVARIADMLLHPGAAFNYDGRQLRYPDIRLIYWVGGNPFHHHQDLNRLRRAWQRVETVIVHEPHWTPLARHADIVLPATLSAERNDLTGSPHDTHLFATEAVSRPFQQARNDHEIFAALATRLAPADGSANDLKDAFTEGRDEAAWLRFLYDKTRSGSNSRPEMPDYETFIKNKVLAFGIPKKAMVMLKDFRDDPDRHPLTTPSGRIEIFSRTVADFNLDGLPGHPVWRAPQEWLGAAAANTYPLHLVTHQPARRLHSQLDQSRHSRAGKLHDREPCLLNAGDAETRGIGDGDQIRIFNGRGSCISAAKLSNNVLPGVAMMATGAWYDPDWENDPTCCKHGNANVLTADLPTSEIAQGPGALTCLVQIEKYEGDPPAVTAFEPPRIVPDSQP